MRASIKSRLFLITYAIILAFIVGLIVLNNTYLERYYIRYRQQTLLAAFDDVQKVNLTHVNTSEQMFEIEQEYNINIHIFKERIVPDNPFNETIGDLPRPFIRLYGSEFSMHDGAISRIMLEFNEQMGGDTSALVNPVPMEDESFIAYFMGAGPQEVIPGSDTQMLSFCVATEESDGLFLYYVLTVTFQSMRDAIGVFNTFTILVGFIFMIISGLVMYLISYKFTNPILEINKVAQNIANLRFDERVNINAKDEIGDLGNSINMMSHQLEDAINELKRANEQLSQDIELKDKIDAMRKEFIANASHELKTPLSLIMGYSEALKLSGLDQATTEEYVNIILDETNKMNKLVMGLLKISQLEGGFTESQLSIFSIVDLIEETLRLFSIVFDENKIHLETSLLDLEVESDYDQLQTVLTNFIANALHHVDENRKVKVYVERLSDTDIRVVVYNSGISLPEAEFERIWESFYKVDKARTRSYGGQGLGLSIAKTTLSNLGHAYGVRNVSGGVEFYFDIKTIVPK
jgi:signal transduction histidine kinase